MPKQKLPRYKVIRCRHKAHPGKQIARFDRARYPGRHVPADVILGRIRRHYKREHPGAFRKSIRKALRTKRKKGLIKGSR